MDVEAITNENNEIDQDYFIWKKHTPFLYDVLFTKCLTWPSLCVTWFKTEKNDSKYLFTNQNLLIGTQTSDVEMNQLIFEKIKYPKKENLNSNNSSSYNSDPDKISVETRINHHGDVNRLRINPKQESLIASKSSKGDVYIFNKHKHECEPKIKNVSFPQAILKGHSKEGYGLSWNTENILASGSDDGLVCLWDINSEKIKNDNINIGSNSFDKDEISILNTNTLIMEPFIKFSDHTSIVEDVCFSPTNPFLLGTVGDDSTLKLYDLRQNKLTNSIVAHDGNINTLDFNPHNNFLLLTGGSDKSINLWDIRNLSSKVHIFSYHKEEVMIIKWNPLREALFASGSLDKKVLVWNLLNIGKEYSVKDLQDGPSELMVSLF